MLKQRFLEVRSDSYRHLLSIGVGPALLCTEQSYRGCISPPPHQIVSLTFPGETKNREDKIPLWSSLGESLSAADCSQYAVLEITCSSKKNNTNNKKQP